jgi:RNA polymerase-binding transcription factor DksA
VTDPAEDAARLERLIADLDGVEAALARLDTGEYGRCEVCGADIGTERLEAHPVEARCAAHRPG